MEKLIKWVLPAGLIVALFAATAIAHEGGDVSACVRNNGAIHIADPVCRSNEVPLTLSSGGSRGGTTFAVREQVYEMPTGPDYDYVELAADCLDGEVVINGGLYWNDYSKSFLSGERTAAGDTGHPVEKSWVVVMLQIPDDEAAQVDYSDLTVFAVCASG